MNKHRDDGALVVASLRFAAALLPPEVTPHEVCTKTALSAIVLASHRVSQQATAEHKLHPGTDPRRLLAKLADSGLDDQLARVAFADITWDSEGVASETLEMELQDVEERAGTTLQRSVCVLISVRDSSSSVEETAVVWFPHRREDNNNSDSKTHKYLLFVAPGRVKVVKTLSELMKKMYEEMALLRGRDATYRAWTLLDGPKRKKETKSTAAIATKSEAETAAWHQDEKVLHRQEDEVPEHEHSPPQKMKNSQRSPVQTRVTRMRVVTETQPKQSMFAFCHEPLVEPVESQHTQHLGKLQEKVASPVIKQEEPALEESASHSPVRRIRVGVSASHANATTMRRGSGGGHRTIGAAWQSVDSEIKRTERIFRDKERERETPDDERDDLAENNVADSQSCRPSKVQEAEDAVETTSSRAARVRPVASRKEPRESMFQFSSTRALPSPPLTPVPSRSTEMTTQQSETVSQSPILTEKRESSQEVEERKTSITSEIEGTPDSPVKKKRSARDRYRSKLGARVWWELEYQATKILQQGVNSENHNEGLHVRNQASKQNAVEPRPATTVKAERRLRAPDPVVETSAADPEVDLQAGPVAREAKMTQSNLRMEIHERVKSSNASQISTKESDVPAPPRAVWDERATMADTSKAQPEKRRDTAVIRQSGSPGYANQAHDEVKSLGTAAAKSTAASSNSKSVKAAMKRIPETTMMAKQISPMASTSFFQARTQVQDDSLRSGSRPSPRKQEPARVSVVSAENHSHSKQSSVAPNQPAADSVRPTPASPQPHPNSERFSTRQSHVRGEAEDEDEDSVLMATMAPRTQSSMQRKVSGSGKSLLQPNFDRDGDFAGAPSHQIPFNVHGRVPIRQPQPTARVVKQSHSERDDPVNVDKEIEAFTPPPPPPHPVDVQPKIRSSPLAMATFISVEPSSGSKDTSARDEDASQRARQQKLTELRQKKLQQLQKAREDALSKKKPGSQQQQQPSSQSQPVSIAVPHETKSRAQATAAPPTTSVMDRGEAFPLSTTTTRTGHRPSNRKLIQNAIEYTLLAGGSLDKERQAAIDALAESTCENFIVLLKSAKELKFRALYEHHIERGRIVKIYGVVSSAPPLLTEDVISQFFRYNSGKKEFAPIDGRSFTVKTDACALVDQLVFKKKSLHRVL